MMKEEEFRQKVMPLRTRMYGLAIHMGLSQEDAADVVQECLIRLWRSRASLPSDQQGLTAYCMVTARNGILSHLTSVYSKVVFAEITEAEVLSVGEDGWSEFAEERLWLQKLIGNLPPPMAKAIRMSAYAELDNKEIATRLGTSEANVRQLLSRGRKKLKEFIGYGWKNKK